MTWAPFSGSRLSLVGGSRRAGSQNEKGGPLGPPSFATGYGQLVPPLVQLKIVVYQLQPDHAGLALEVQPT
jgi:hypothetical protein